MLCVQGGLNQATIKFLPGLRPLLSAGFFSLKSVFFRRSPLEHHSQLGGNKQALALILLAKSIRNFKENDRELFYNRLLNSQISYYYFIVPGSSKRGCSQREAGGDSGG
jgi:hypothetical protein